MRICKYAMLFILFVGLLAGCSAARIDGVMNPLDIKTKPTIGIASDNALADAVGTSLMVAGFRIIERNRLDQVLSEHALNQSGALENHKYIEVGKILNIDALLFASCQFDNHFAGRIASAVIKIVDVKTGIVVGSFNYQNGKGGRAGSVADSDMKESLPETAKRIVDEIARSFNSDPINQHGNSHNSR